MTGDVSFSQDLTVDGSGSFGSLVIPKHNVEMKGNELACTKPTYAWEFRNSSSTNTVYDLVGGVAAVPSGATSTSEGMVFDAQADIVNVGTVTLDTTVTFEFYMYYTSQGTGSNYRIIEIDDGAHADVTVAYIIRSIGGDMSVYYDAIGTTTSTGGEFDTDGVFLHTVVSFDS